MKINFPLLDDPIEIENATVVVVEEQSLFAKLIKQFYQFSEKEQLKVYDDSFKSLKSTELLVITDILGFDVNAPSVVKLIYADLEDQLNEKPEVKTNIEQMANKITEMINLELLSHELDLESDEITILELFKALGIKIETQSDTIYEKIYEILQIFKYLSRKKLLVFINVCSYFSIDEFIELKHYIAMANIDVLFLEPRKFFNIQQYVIDSNFYLSH
ncbi:type II-A CRISPR-associated protein Csn2 [Vagococcus silagei]|uniref:Type II-A CRISPR-associated protein Csn2 n=1 Tax=Vagococcus silagei TaxID=2508885 RepID=A0A4S3AZP2_9ENTE|nr:type II-A CRISPR-associated protein Csn2 [Vagococcus silagei]THB60274.1 type II-A CRISPR-associated protein Csn2 [Vagococcus silagei]